MDRSHRQLDLRSLDMHRLIAQKVRENPDLWVRAAEILARWRSSVNARTLPLLDQWQSLMDAGMDECLSVATEDSERAAELRQSSPFSCLLTTKERNAFLKNWKPDETI